MVKKCVVLAHYDAEKMKTKKAKVMSVVNFRPMLEYVIDAAKEIAEQVIVYTGKNYEEIKDYFGDSVSYAREAGELCGECVVVRGDMPCLSGDMLKELCQKNECADGVYFAKSAAEVEDIISKEKGEGACSTRADIASADRLIRLKINGYHMENGVTIINPEDTYIDKSVKIGADTVIYPGAIIKGDTVIGEDCTIMGGCMIENSKIGNGVSMKISTVTDSKIGNNTTVGPYAYVRPLSDIGDNVKIGDFVEVKKSVIGDGTKISHLTYVGDSKVGKNVNFGCGTVTVNYDGKNKFLTEIGDNAFIGCNTNLVSPVKVGDGAFIAAGSTITDEVPENGFAIARQRQTVKENWVKPKDRA